MTQKNDTDVVESFRPYIAQHNPRAIDDIMTAAKIFLAILEEKSGTLRLGELMGATREKTSAQGIPWHGETFEAFPIYLKDIGYMRYGQHFHVLITTN